MFIVSSSAGTKWTNEIAFSVSIALKCEIFIVPTIVRAQCECKWERRCVCAIINRSEAIATLLRGVMHRNGDDTSIPARARSFVRAVIKRRRDICSPLGVCVGTAIAACACEGLRLFDSRFRPLPFGRFIVSVRFAAVLQPAMMSQA